MILAQLALLYICVRYRPLTGAEALGLSTRPLSFWQWRTYPQYLEFLAALIVVLSILLLIFGRMAWFVSALGFVALGLESTLPLPQLYSNWKHKSLYGFRASTLLGWVGGDAFKTVYFFVQNSPLQFQVCLPSSSQGLFIMSGSSSCFRSAQFFSFRLTPSSSSRGYITALPSPVSLRT
ncbi:hypothetical protein BOTBODRAFT_485507 [Botryobasidium botryosum FD-172 SS1]|uniref:Uncharacterized protein n=1 Tax=Botryobasidium botryosum (strain FD-172 SS1) TaxID=930990 RepID=A0A067MWT0_BOTB1|nr:hypothetical protein BOTBODRAFT_485507 [Botryobasidium botryosum FD-172 SS1]